MPLVIRDQNVSHRIVAIMRTSVACNHLGRVSSGSAHLDSGPSKQPCVDPVAFHIALGKLSSFPVPLRSLL